ncbi:hypothetical protein FANTH_2820 [Fusarium anthophilum]|uniref:Ankyrin n=1 Tax=Fusarium anthophilum TaxID=48485 RepID=A0A8H4ZTB0_9HYPO|nr:hypothetical protein FANTH_2820 [Fusarium anthophilum]
MAVPSFDEVAYKTVDYDPNPVAPKSATHVDFQDDTGRTALSFAAQAGDVEAIGKLFDRQADVELADTDGQTPLLWAAAFRNMPDSVELLLQNGADIEAIADSFKTPLYVTSAKGYLGVVQRLLEKGTDTEASDPILHQPPLSVAAEHGHEDVVRLLLAHGANVEAKDFHGHTARDEALDQWHTEIAKLLETNQG